MANDNYDGLTLEELEAEYIRRKVYYRGDKSREIFIGKLRKDDEHRKERVDYHSKFALKDLKRMVKERDNGFDFRIWLELHNLRLSTITKPQLINYIIQKEDEHDRSKYWKEREEIEVREREDWVEQANKEREERIENLKKIKKIGKDIDALWVPLHKKEDKTTKEYEYLVKLLLLRLNTRKELSRPIDYGDLPQNTLSLLEEKFKKVTSEYQ